MKTVLIVEDHSDTREWLENTVQSAFPEASIASAATVAAAQKHISEQRFCLAILDINLPDGNGIDLAETIIAKHSETYVVMATIYDDDRHLFKALQVGVHGYLLKEQQTKDIQEKLENIVKGEPPLSASIARKVLRFFSKKTQDTPNHNLTPREEEVLSLVAKGMSRKEIARELDITPNTAAGYIKNIYQKLSISSRSQAALAADQLGLLRSD